MEKHSKIIALAALPVTETKGFIRDWIEFIEAWNLRITLSDETLNRLYEANYPK